MDHVVVAAAEQDEVPVVGFATVAPVFDVVGVAVADVAVAAGEAAAAVAGCDLAEQFAWHCVAGTSEADRCTMCVAQDGVDDAVA